MCENVDWMEVKEIISRDFLLSVAKIKTMKTIEENFGIKLNYSRFNTLLNEIQQEWAAGHVSNNVLLLRAIELKKIEAREHELWQAWHDEREFCEEKADARIMGEIRRCSEQRSKLMGLEPGRSKDKEGGASPIMWKESKNYGTKP